MSHNQSKPRKTKHLPRHHWSYSNGQYSDLATCLTLTYKTAAEAPEDAITPPLASKKDRAPVCSGTIFPFGSLTVSASSLEALDDAQPIARISSESCAVAIGGLVSL